MNVELPVVEGYLEKQGEKWPKGWKKRYFALDGKKLYYYHTQSDVPDKPISSISLEPATTVLLHPNVRSGARYEDCGFSIENSQRTFLLLAPSKSERNKWLIELNQVLAILYPGRVIFVFFTHK